MEGPMAATKDSLDLSKTALAKWPGHLGERFHDNWLVFRNGIKEGQPDSVREEIDGKK